MVSKENISAWLDELVRTPSVSGTEDENLGALKAYEIIGRLPYFQNNPENLKLIPVENDNLNRNVVSAFVPAAREVRDTIIITGHYDVVGVEEYGHLAQIAFDIKEITKRVRELSLDGDSIKDLESGDWLFGRGAGDMKYGIALCIEALRYFSEEAALNANLLFLGVPGEETNSEGMLQAVKIIHGLQTREGLKFRILLNAESYCPDETDADKTRYIHIGSSGKIMPLFLFCGVGTHAGEMPFDGFDANLMAAKLHERLHHNPDFCQTARGLTTPPPACLKMADLKEMYSITTPIYAASYYNLITLDLDVNELIEKLKKLALEAFRDAAALETRGVRAYEELTGETPGWAGAVPKVVMFKDLYEAVKAGYDGDFDLYIKDFTDDLADKGMEIQDISIRVVRETANFDPDKTPKIVIGFVPPYYPDNYPDENYEPVRLLRQNMDYIAGYAEKQYGEALKVKDFYMGISDMCYTGLNGSRTFGALFDNMPGIGNYYNLPTKELEGINVPSIIFGPYAKDLHKCSERLNISYNFDVLPGLFIEFISKMGG